MISFDLDFYPRTETRGDEYGQFDETLESFLGILSRDNNVIRNWQILELWDKVQVRVLVPEAVALEGATWNKYVHAEWEKILECCDQVPVFHEIDESHRDEDICHCPDSESLILFTTFLETDFCVRCGTCYEWIPLYRLPYLKDESEHSTLASWQGTYSALDLLWMNSFIGERFAYEQLSQLQSDLMKWSSEIAEELGAKTQSRFTPF